MRVEFQGTSAEGPAGFYQTCPPYIEQGGGVMWSYRRLTAVNFSKGEAYRRLHRALVVLRVKCRPLLRCRNPGRRWFRCGITTPLHHQQHLARSEFGKLTAVNKLENSTRWSGRPEI
jgi:hypothetical protein